MAGKLCEIQNIVCKPKTFLGTELPAFTIIDSLWLLCAESGKLTGRVEGDYVAGKT